MSQNSSATAEIQKVGLYNVNLSLTNGIPGAPSLALRLVVNAAKNTIFGSGEIFQPLNPKNPDSHIVIDELRGEIKHTGLGEVQKIAVVSGKYLGLSSDGNKGAFLGHFEANVAVNADWEGTGSFTYHQGTFEDYTVAPKD